MRREALKLRQAARRLAERSISLLSKIGDTCPLQEIKHRGAGESMGKPTRGQYCVRANTVVPRADWRVWTKENLARIF